MFYSEPANQTPRLIVSGPRKDANPSVNDKLRGNLERHFDFRALSVLSAVVSDIGYSAQGVNSLPN